MNTESEKDGRWGQGRDRSGKVTQKDWNELRKIRVKKIHSHNKINSLRAEIIYQLADVGANEIFIKGGGGMYSEPGKFKLVYTSCSVNSSVIPKRWLRENWMIIGNGPIFSQI